MQTLNPDFNLIEPGASIEENATKIIAPNTLLGASRKNTVLLTGKNKLITHTLRDQKKYAKDLFSFFRVFVKKCNYT